MQLLFPAHPVLWTDKHASLALICCYASTHVRARTSAATQAILVFSPKPAGSLLSLDAYIVACRCSAIEPVIVYNKCDMAQDIQDQHHEAGNHDVDNDDDGHEALLHEDGLRDNALQAAEGATGTQCLAPPLFAVYRDLGLSVFETSTRTGAACSPSLLHPVT